MSVNKIQKQQIITTVQQPQQGIQYINVPIQHQQPINSSRVTSSSSYIISQNNITSHQKSNSIISSQQIKKPQQVNSIITYDDQYIKSTKIYNTGIKEDPVPGSKFGKGNQSLNSSYWISDLSIFIADNILYLKTILENAKQAGLKYNNGEFLVLTQQANQLFIKAENQGLRTPESINFWLMASWLCMAAAEVDNFQYSKYSQQERQQMKEQFYKKYEEAQFINDVSLSEQQVGMYQTQFSRVDLIPAVALERLGIHNELCVIKFEEENSQKWKTEGFYISKRISSAKRHFDGVHNHDHSEDHIAHLIWNFMAIYHVLKTKPHLNDLFNYES